MSFLPASRIGWMCLICGMLTLNIATARAQMSGQVINNQFGRYQYPPSYYGYPLDDRLGSYYGGGRYREYYSFGRGSMMAEMSPWAGPSAELWVRRPLIVWPKPVAVVQVEQPTMAKLLVHVPADAEIWLNEQPTQQTGTLRQFMTPPLQPGAKYAYTLRVRWRNAAEYVEQTREIQMQAGDRLEASFPSSEPTPRVLTPLAVENLEPPMK